MEQGLAAGGLLLDWNFNCVHVYEVSYAAGWVGIASIRYDSNLHMLSTGLTIRLNSYEGRRLRLTTGQRQGVACQEIGHMIGLDHRQYTDDCTYDKDIRYFPRLPSSHDYSLLSAIYNH